MSIVINHNDQFYPCRSFIFLEILSESDLFFCAREHRRDHVIMVVSKESGESLSEEIQESLKVVPEGTLVPSFVIEEFNKENSKMLSNICSQAL